MPRLVCSVLFALVLAGPVNAQPSSLEHAYCAHEGDPGGMNRTLPNAQGTIIDGPDTRVILVFVRFLDDNFPETGGWPDYPNKTQLPPYADDILKQDFADLPNADATLSSYFYEQSKTSAAGPSQLRVVGDVLPTDTTTGEPIAYVTKFPNSEYHRGEGGYARLTEEILDYLFVEQRIDPARYDLNGDGYLDHLFLYVRSEETQDLDSNPDPTQRVRYYSGCSTLDANGCSGPDEFGDLISNIRTANLSYMSPSRAEPVEVDWFWSGSHQFVRDPGNIVYQPSAVRLLAHEWGHEFWEPYFNHIANVSANLVPGNEPFVSRNPRDGYSFVLMQGSRYGSARSDNLMSPLERLLQGWIAPRALDPSDDGASFTVGDLYTTADAFTLAVPKGTLYIANRQRVGAFDVLQTQPDHPNPPFDKLLNGLRDEGVLVQFSTDGEDRIDPLPADNTLDGPSWLVGETSPAEGDLYGPDPDAPSPKTQLTPWTMPNINGCAGYATDPLCDGSAFVPSWQAITDIRYTGGADGEMAFDYLHDFRVGNPEVVISADSWMGQETATSSGGTSYTFTAPVRLTDSAILRVWENSTITFAGGVIIEAGSELMCEDGSTCIVADGIAEGGGSCVMSQSGGTVRIEGTFTTRSSGFFANLAGGVIELGAGASVVTEAGSGRHVIEAGSTFRLDSGASMVFEDPVRLLGTASAPIRFERLDPSQPWGTVERRGSMSTLEHVVLDGGETNVTVSSRATLRDVTSRNGGANLLVVGTANGSGGFGGFFPPVDPTVSAIVRDGRFEDAEGNGVEVVNASVYLFDSVVSGSGSDGVHLSASDFGGHDSKIEANGRYGVNVTADSHMRGGASRIAENGSHEVYVGTGGRANLGGTRVENGPYLSGYGPDGNACNAIISTGDTAAEKLVYNATPYTVSAHWNYWESSSSSGWVSGAVNGAWALAQDPTVPHPQERCMGKWEVNPALTPEGSTVDPTVKIGDPDRVRVRMAALRDTLAQAPRGLGALDAVGALAALVRLDRADSAGSVVENRETFRSLAAPLLDRSDTWPAAEAAVLALAREEATAGRLDAAGALLDALLAVGPTEYHGRAAQLLRVNVLAASGQSGPALTVLAELEAAEAELASADPAFVPADYSRLRTHVAAGAPAGAAAPKRRTSVTSLDSAGNLTAAPHAERLETGLSAPSPNPTRSDVTVTLTLAEAGPVEVALYDVTGRRVAVLVSGVLSEGAHTLTTSTTVLAPGVYVIRATTPHAGNAGPLAHRLTVVR